METGTEVTVEVVEDCSVVQGGLVTAFSAALSVWRLSLMNGVFLFSVSPLAEHGVLTPNDKKRKFNKNTDCVQTMNIAGFTKWNPL